MTNSDPNLSNVTSIVNPIFSEVDTKKVFSLLEDDAPLIVKRNLAVLIGLNESIMLQQIKYWVTNPMNKNQVDGRIWVYKTISEWQEEFKFFSERTIRRTIESLVEKKLIVVKALNPKKSDRTHWYTLNTSLEVGTCGQNGHMHLAILATSCGQNGHMYIKKQRLQTKITFKETKQPPPVDNFKTPKRPIVEKEKACGTVILKEQGLGNRTQLYLRLKNVSELSEANIKTILCDYQDFEIINALEACKSKFGQFERTEAAFIMGAFKNIKSQRTNANLSDNLL